MPNLNASPLTETNLFCGVTTDSAGNAALPSAGAVICGVLYGISTSANEVSVRGPGDGVVKAQYGGTVTLPAQLKVNASGQFVTASASDIAAGSAVAIALEAGSSSEYHRIVLLGSAGAQTAVSGDETVTSGALSAYTTVSYISCTGTQAYTLPNGLYAGQTKRIECSVAASTPIGTLTITTPLSGDGATYVFNEVGQVIELVWKVAGGTAGWHLTRILGDETVTSGNIGQWPVSYISVTGTQAYTLPNGMYEGQTKRLECSVAATTPVGTITITSPFTGEQATYVFNTVSQALEFVWRGNAVGWHITRKQRAGKNTYTVGTNNVGAGDMYDQIDLSITGTVNSSFANGTVNGEIVHITVSTAASTPVGGLTSTAIKSLVGVATATGITAIGATTSYGVLMWDGAFWQALNSTGFTYT